MTKIVANLTVLFPLVVTLFFTGCAGKTVIQKRELEALMGKTASEVRKKGDYAYLQGMRVGSTGYCYVLGTDGRVLYHPRREIIGMVMRDDPFVQYIVKKGEGCLRAYMNGLDRIILFRSLDDGSLLCLTISPAETGEEIECDSLPRLP